MFGKGKPWWRRSRRAGIGLRTEPDESGLYLIEYDMMLKGSVYRRAYGDVRQLGVTVDGKTRLVTSGDKVDRITYEALLAAGALREDYYGVQKKPKPPQTITDDSITAKSA